MGNLALQLIPGTPAVHPDDDLIVGHIAIEVESEHMSKIREGLQQLGWQSRKNVSVPNPDKANTPVDQVKSLFLQLEPQARCKLQIIEHFSNSFQGFCKGS